MRVLLGLVWLALLVSPADAAIAYRSQSSLASATGTTDVLTEPSGAAAGDVFVAMTHASNVAAFTPPSGWTTIFSGLSSDNTVQYWLGYVVRGGSAPALTWVFATGVYRYTEIDDFSGVSTSSPINASAQTVSDVAAPIPTPPPATSTVANTWAVVVAFKDEGCLWIAPSGYTLRSGDNAQVSIMADTPISLVGTETPGQFGAVSGMGNTVSRWAATVLLAPAGGVASGFLLLGVGR